MSPQKRMCSPTKENIKSGWVERTWSTFIERVEEDVLESPKGKLFLSSFQRKKFTYFFYHVLDLNTDHVISQEDFDGLNCRVRHYMDWTMNNPLYLTLIFLSYFLTSAAKFALKEECFDFGDNFDEAEEDDSPTKDSVSTRLPGAVPQPLFQF